MVRIRSWFLLICLLLLTLGANAWRLALADASSGLSPKAYLPLVQGDGERPFTVAVIGDYGQVGAAQTAVSQMVASWNPDIVITVGDNNYDHGEASTIDANVGQYYSQFIYPYSGSYTPGQAPNRFFPTLGNHDWETDDGQPYYDYFPISETAVNSGSSGNERYYDFVWGPVHFFALNSNSGEPDGTSKNSVQAQWLQTQMQASTSMWKIVYFHHAPYSSGHHGNNEMMQWPFSDWGATAVLTGHDHHYERLRVDGLPYFVNGLGGRSIRPVQTAVSGSEFRYDDDYGAMRITATDTTLQIEFYSIANPTTPIDGISIIVIIDPFSLPHPNPTIDSFTLSP